MSDAPVLCVSACILMGDKVLLVRRANAPAAGKYSLPGGRVEPGETLLQAVGREIAEETGLTEVHLTFLCHHEVISPGRHFVIAVFCGAASAEPVAGDDATEAFFATMEEVATLQNAGQTTDGLMQVIQQAALAKL
ncbi:NUDIX hydrolase [Aureimonas fodinaquatilis]|uniref:NUDIX hydrolase n=1 Tax=Aureimonas fodinaquatilis TaxID=2565783 RepID=A0A5B0DYD5_9HYPH|nr:NUDIX hydrolase [Aureimonas fodinaquatilis]KAA0971022.1 NUDIX hydrolase [Aureimonas fodinaquatilis]